MHLYHGHDGYPSYLGARLLGDLGARFKRPRCGRGDNIHSLATAYIKGGSRGAFELTGGVHGDESYFYLIDLDSRRLTCCIGVIAEGADPMEADKVPDLAEPFFVCNFTDQDDIERCLGLAKDD